MNEWVDGGAVANYGNQIKDSSFKCDQRGNYKITTKDSQFW